MSKLQFNKIEKKDTHRHNKQNKNFQDAVQKMRLHESQRPDDLILKEINYETVKKMDFFEKLIALDRWYSYLEEIRERGRREIKRLKDREWLRNNSNRLKFNKYRRAHRARLKNSTR